MLESLVNIDKSLLLFFNGYHNSFWDHFFWLFTQMATWIPVLAVMLFVIIKNKKQEAIWLILGIALAILISDQISSGLLKPLVARLRPSRDPSLEGLVHIVNGYKGGMFSFTSSHAANSFSIAIFCSLLFRNKLFSFSIFSWAILNAYSRIYLGVHFPGDILVGTMIGLMAGYIPYILLKKIRPVAVDNSTHIQNYSSKVETRVIPDSSIYQIIYTLILTIVLIAIFYKYSV